ncbi:hypothetical protein [Hymenobacter cheonanensis]|uniref:hypothetical protein n=1 Tax=Hymenobacter sp. CA2-7 TaxID=3063993 RepID=UPI0027123E0D|nr:hypothetical protein [Hymenobacter sp. CA2-7]MDO7884129.1 hypothetical protein [Hymenobacter sp. CA2-7]
MPRTLLLIVLIFAVVLELALAGGAFFAPAFTLAKFGVQYGPSTAFLGYLTGWFLLFVSLVAGLALGRVWQGKPGYAGLCYLLGWWWAGIGMGIYMQFGRPDNLLLDSLKGLLIIILTWLCRAQGLVVRR